MEGPSESRHHCGLMLFTRNLMICGLGKYKHYEEKRNSLLLFDVDFPRSKSYFGALQHLQLHDEWISETLKAPEQLRMSCLFGIELCHPRDFEMLDEELNQLSSKYGEPLLSFRDRMKDKTEETTSLRDGLRSFSHFSGS